MHYHEFDPDPALASHAASYWGMTVGGHVAPGYPHRIIPDGCVSLVCTRRGSGEVSGVIVGPRTREMTVPVFPGDRFWGIRFWPDAGSLVLGRAAPALRDQVLLATPGDADGIAALSAHIADCPDALAAGRGFDAWLAPRVAAVAAPLDGAVRAVIIVLVASHGEMDVAQLARRVSLSARQLQRRFGKAVGLTPKQFARIRRLRGALAELLAPHPRTWSAVAAELGFADQAHLTREVRALAGLTPAELAVQVRFIAHGRVRP